MVRPCPPRPGLALAAMLLVATPAAVVSADAPPPVPAPPDIPAKIRLEDALRIQSERSLALASADATVASAAAQARIAGALPNPTLGFGVGKSWDCPGGGCENPVWSGSLGDQGALAFVVTGVRGLAVDTAEQGLKAATASRSDVLRNQTSLLKQQFVNMVIAARALQFTREEASLAEETVALARKRLQAGAMSEADVARLEVLQLQLEQAVDRAAQATRQARAALAQTLGVRPAPVEFEADGPEFSSALLPPRLSGATQASLTEEARRNRPDLDAVRAQVEQGRLSASLARRQLVPQFALQLSYTQQGSPGNYFTPPTGTVGLSVPLPVLYQQQGQVGQAEAATRLAEVALAKLEAQITAEVAIAWSAMVAARSAAQRGEQRLLERSRTARDLVRLQYTKGAASLLEHLDAQRVHINNQIDYLFSLAAYWTAVFQLEQAVGTTFLP